MPRQPRATPMGSAARCAAPRALPSRCARAPNRWEAAGGGTTPAEDGVRSVTFYYAKVFSHSRNKFA